MPTPPIYERQVQTKPTPVTTLGASLRPVSNPYIKTEGFEKAADALSEYATKQKQAGDEVSLLSAQRQMDDWEATNLYDPTTGALSKKGKNAINLPVDLTSKYDQDMIAIRDGLANDEQKLAFEKAFTSRRDNLQKTLFSHERQEMDTFATETSKAAETSSINRAALNWNNPKVVGASIEAAKQARAADDRRKGLPEEAIANGQREVESSAHLTVLTRMSDANAKGAIAYYKANQSKMTGPDILAAQKLIAPTERKYKASKTATRAMAGASPKFERDEIISYVMTDLEGGDKVITDSNGYTAKYGINAQYNADLYKDGNTPTEEQAKQRYTENYWNKIDGDNLPVDMRLPAMSFAATSGPEAANKLIAAAKGDTRQFIELQKIFYKRLAEKNPEKYGPYLEGWLNRVARVSGDVDQMYAGTPDLTQVYAKIDADTDDIEVATDAKEIVNKQMKAIADQRKAREDAASTEAWQYTRENREVPPSVVARMNPKDAAEMQTKMQPDPELYQTLRGQVLAGADVDLGSYRWRLGAKYDDLVELREKPEKQANARTVDSVLDNSYGVLLGKSKPSKKGDFEKVEQFRRAVDTEINAYQRANNKPAGAAEVQAITDRLLLKVSTGGWFSGKKFLFQVPHGQEIEVEGLPEDRRYFVAGVQVNNRDILAKISGYLTATNQPLTDDTIKDTYNRLVRQGAIVEKYDGE